MRVQMKIWQLKNRFICSQQPLNATSFFINALFANRGFILFCRINLNKMAEMMNKERLEMCYELYLTDNSNIKNQF